MAPVFSLTFENVVKVMIFIAIGYILRNSKGFPKESGKTLSTMAALLFSPAYTVRSLIRDFTPDTLNQKLLILGYGVLFLVVAFALAFFVCRLFPGTKAQKYILLYAFAIPNYGYFGYPLVESVFGNELLADFIVFTQPLNFATATLGYWLLTQRKDFRWKSFLLSPVVWSPFLGAALGLSGIALPELVGNTLSALGNCMSPTVMILLGFVLGSVSFRELFGQLRSYGISMIRLLLLPLAGGCLYYLCGARGIWLILPLLTLSMPIGANIVVFPESCGIDTRENAKAVFLSYILAVAVLPLTFSLITRLCGF